jgi:hypothetical protein
MFRYLDRTTEVPSIKFLIYLNNYKLWIDDYCWTGILMAASCIGRRRRTHMLMNIQIQICHSVRNLRFHRGEGLCCICGVMRPVGCSRPFGEICCLHLLLYMKAAGSAKTSDSTYSWQGVTNHYSTDVSGAALKQKGHETVRNVFFTFHWMKLKDFVRYESIMAASDKITVFWAVTQNDLVCRNRSFGRTSFRQFQCMFLFIERSVL